MVNVDKLIQALMEGVSLQLKEHFANYRREAKGFRALARDHALLLQERYRPLSPADISALDRRIALSEHLMKSQLLTLAIELNKAAWAKVVEKKGK